MIKIQINVHKFYCYDSRDNLISQALLSCYEAIERFTPYKVKYKPKDESIPTTYYTAFNYFSLTIKKSLMFYTMKNKKNRFLKDISDYPHLETEQTPSQQLEWQLFLNFAEKHFNRFFTQTTGGKIEVYREMFDHIKTMHYSLVENKRTFISELRATFPYAGAYAIRRMGVFLLKTAVMYNKV